MVDRPTRIPAALHPLARQTLLGLRSRCGVAPGERLLVAVSGGADSVALLRLLLEVAPRHGLQLEVAHFDHALRPDSALDAAFVEQLAREHGLEVHTGRWTSPARGEDAARRARYAFLEEMAIQRQCSALALGQHLDDQVETVLLRMGRGAGLRGWLGMAWRRPGRVPIVRPLLAARHAALLGYLRSIHQSWREDSTNRDLGPVRNRLRHVVLPALATALGAGWDERYLEGLEDLRAAWSWIESNAALLLESARFGPPSAVGVESLDLEILRRAPEPLLRATLQRWIESAPGRDLGRRHLEAAAHVVRNGQSGQTTDLPDGLQLVLEQGRVSLVRRVRQPGAGLGRPRSSDPGPRAAAGQETPRETTKAAEPASDLSRVLPPGLGREKEQEPGPIRGSVNGVVWRLEIQTAAGALAWAEITGRRHGAESVGPPRPESLPESAATLVDLDGLSPPFEVRASRPGDRLRPLGAPGTKKLCRILQDRRVPRRLRAGWPLVVDRQGIVWVAGLEIAERARLSVETRRALRLRLAVEPPPVAQPGQTE